MLENVCVSFILPSSATDCYNSGYNSLGVADAVELMWRVRQQVCSARLFMWFCWMLAV
jgi:hypothetical protein